MFPPHVCEVIQLERITGSDPVHAGSNPALAAKLNVVAESSGRMPDCLSGGTGSTPVATATGRGPRRATLARWGGGVRTRWEGRWSPKPVLAGSNPVTPARVLKSEHGIAAGASGLQPDDASSTLAARSKSGVRIGAVPRIASPEARVQFPYSAPRLRRCSQDSKASACKADHRECNSPRRLQSFRWCSSVGRARAS